MMSVLYIVLLMLVVVWTSLAFFGPAGVIVCVAIFALVSFVSGWRRLMSYMLIMLSILLLIAFLLPAVGSVRGAARRMQCMNNLKNIALAVLTYEGAYKTLPPPYLADKNGKPMHSWRVLILPYLDQKDLYDRYNFDEPWDGPNNKKLLTARPTVYACPSDETAPSQNATNTSCVAVVGEHAAWDKNKPRSLDGILKHASSTIMLAETSGCNIAWTEPRDLSLDILESAGSAADLVTVSSSYGRFGHGLLYDYEYDIPTFANVAMLDGSVRSLDGDILTNSNLRKLLTIGGATSEGIAPPGPYREQQIAKTTLRLRSCVALAVWIVSVVLLLHRAVRVGRARRNAAATDA